LSPLFCSGSPADQADLLVGDEIVEVNGKSLENASHAEVIAYIHKVRSSVFIAHNDCREILHN